MKTPMQEHIEWLTELRKNAIAKNLHEDLEWIDLVISNAKSMLEKEKGVMCEFAFRFNHDAFTENYIKAEFEETFNNK